MKADNIVEVQKDSEHRRAVLDSCGAAVLIVEGESFLIKESNQLASGLFGLELPQLKGCALLELLQARGVQNAQLREYLLECRKEALELTLAATATLPEQSCLLFVGCLPEGLTRVVSFFDVTALRMGERRQADLAVFRRAIIDRSLVGIFLTDSERAIREVSDQALKMFGYSREELIGQSFRRLHVSDEKFAEAANYFARLMSQGHYSMEYPYRRKDGSTIWCSVAGTPLDPDDLQKGTVWTLLDISERKRMEEEVRDSEERYSAIVNHSPSIVLIHMEGRIVFVNQAGLRDSGYTQEEVLGASLFRFLTPASQARVLNAFKERSQGRDIQDYEIEFLMSSGVARNLVVKSTPIRYSGSPATLVILIDITERKRVEERLAYRESLEKLLTQFSTRVVNAHLSELGPVLEHGLAEVGRHCHFDRALILCCNGAGRDMQLRSFWDFEGAKPHAQLAERLRGCHRWSEYLLSQREVVFEDVSHMDQRWSAEKALLEEQGVRAIAALPIVHSQVLMGAVVFECTQATRVWSEDEIHFMRVYSALLASSIKRESAELALKDSKASLEAALIKANDLADQAQQSSRSKSLFLANMSHELRTPLNVILGMSEILVEGMQGPLNEDQTSNVRAIEESGRHLLSLINDILDLAKIEAGRMRLELSTIETTSVCDSSLRMMAAQAERKGIRLGMDLSGAPSRVRGDVIRIKQVLLNLLGNAVKFTPEGGEVLLSVFVEPHSGLVCFQVRDSGIGIPEEYLKSLFQPFMQVDNSLVKKHGGTGLGLALVRHFAEMHGGDVVVESLAGKGSIFTMRIPGGGVRDQEGRTEALPGVREPIELPLGLRALVAEDHPGNALVITNMLRSRGIEFMLAENGREAVRLAREWLPDMILMDVQMPEMDGLEATRLLKSEPATAGIPIVCLTAYAMSGDRERCLAAGANAYLSKPIDFHELFDVIARLCVARRSPA